MNYPKLYTYFLSPVTPPGSGTGALLATGTRVNFQQNNFFDNIKIVGFSIFESDVLSQTPQGDNVSNRADRLNITLVNSRGEFIIENLPADIFAQAIDNGNLPNGLIRKFKPFKIDLQKSYVTATNTIEDNLVFGFNFWYYEI